MLRIRPAHAADEADLIVIDRATWTADVSPVTPPEPDEPLLDAERLSDVLVAEQDGAVSGYVRLRQSGPLPSRTHVLAIDGLAVAPDRPGKGIGRALVEAAVEEAGRRGARKVALRVLAPNTRARRLYKSCGLVIEGVLRGEFLLNGEYVDDVALARTTAS